MRRTVLGSLVVGLLLSLMVAVPAASQPLAPPVPDYGDDGPEIVRLAGPGRLETAVALSQAGWETSTAAVLARADDPADALGGTVLAHSLDAPLLLSARDGLPPVVAAELRRLGVREVRLLGGTEALSQDVADDARRLGIDVARLAGEDRYATGVAVARAVGETATAYLVPGDGRSSSESIDALAAGALAAVRGVPLLLVPSGDRPDERFLGRDGERPEEALLSAEDDLPPSVAGYLREHQPRVREIGPVFARYGKILDLYEVSTLAGSDRYATARGLFDEWAADGRATAGTILLGDGSRGADLLAAGALSARLEAPLLLVDGQDPAASATTYAALASLRPRLDELLVIGGQAAISEEALASALRPERQVLEPPGSAFSTLPMGADPRTLEARGLVTSAYFVAAPSAGDPQRDRVVQVILRNTGTDRFLRGFTSGGCDGPKTITSEQWDGRAWRPRPYLVRETEFLYCVTDVPSALLLDPGEEASYPFATRAPGRYRIDLEVQRELSVVVEVLGCRSCEPGDAEGQGADTLR